MNTEEALRFLRRHQPMSPTEELSDQLCEEYDEVRKYFEANPDPRCIPLFLGSFGEGDCHGVYQLVEDVLCKFDRSEVVPHLLRFLRSTETSVRCWSADMACNFPHQQLIEPLMSLAKEDDVDVRSAAIIALSQIDEQDVFQFLSGIRKSERDKNLCEILDDILTKRPQ